MDFDFTTETITPDTTNLLTIGGPGALEVPVGTTAERPVTGLSNGALRYNTSLNVLEGYVNLSWSTVATTSTSVASFSGGTTGLTPNSPTTGAVVLAGTLVLANGGTGASLTAVNGGAVYSTGSALAITAAGTSGQVLTSNGAGAPTWQNATASLQLYDENPSSPTAPAATGTNSIALGSGSASSAVNSVAVGDGTSASLWSSIAEANGKFATAGDAQGIRVVARVITTNNTATEMFLDGAGASQRLVLPNNSAWNYFIQIVARRTDATGKWSAWNFTGLIKKDGTAGTTSNSVSRTNIDKNGIGTDPTVTADTTNGSLLITVTGNTGETIRWVATIQIAQVTN
jgi:hypothetical protein